jgi:hypothetical protein
MSARGARPAALASLLLLVTSVSLLGPGCASHTPPRRSFVVPAAEIIAMDALINLAARPMMEADHYAVTTASIRRNLRSPWIVDADSFAINQFLHPYQGAMYHTIARSSGLNYWQSAAYTFAGSALWEIAGETTPPSKNDQIASGIAGSFLGEPLHRISHVILVKGGEQPGFLRALAATLVSPPTVVNRGLFGDRFDAGVPGEMPSADLRLEIGMTASHVGRPRSWSASEFSSPFIGFAVDYGVPPSRGNTPLKPFDHFRLEGIASSGGFQNLAARGLLAGGDFGTGVRGSGVWGLYGGYEYFAPGIFRVSSTNVSVGTTAQLHLGALTLQGTALLGIGYTAAQSGEVAGSRDYHYGAAPHAVVALRAIGGRRASLDVGAREYLISDAGGFGTAHRDVIRRGEATFALRVAGKHGVAVRSVWAERRAARPELPRLTQHESTLGIFYTFLGSGGFGGKQ